jgi:hypothetical protein
LRKTVVVVMSKLPEDEAGLKRRPEKPELSVPDGNANGSSSGIEADPGAEDEEVELPRMSRAVGLARLGSSPRKSLRQALAARCSSNAEHAATITQDANAAKSRRPCLGCLELPW